MTFNFGDIYLVQFEPSIGHEYQGRRPGIIAQDENISKISPLISVIPITSRVSKIHSLDISIQKDEKNRLSEDSIIKTYHISSFGRSRFLFKIGKAGSPTIRQVRGYLRRHFGL